MCYKICYQYISGIQVCSLVLKLILIYSTCVCFIACKPQFTEGILKSKNILILGGNGLLGAPTVERLIAAGHNCTLINRGNWYWNSAVTIKPYVRHFKFDRMQSLSKCEPLVELLSNNHTFDFVIDFSAYHVFAVNEAVALLKDHTSLYIYISSDSVYEVCLKNHSHPSVETDSIRPTDFEDRQRLALKDDYGHRKLESEEALEFQRNNGGIPFITLRLPDVVGPRDNTYRWWIYQMWLRLQPYLDKLVSIPAFLSEKSMSFVYADDVAKLIVRISSSGVNEESLDQAYNLAFRETFTLRQFVTDVKLLLNLTAVVIHNDQKPDAFRLFPSVTLGPININKAEKLLNWDPTPWGTALKDTVDFYESAISRDEFEVPRRDIIRSMQVYFSDHPYRVLIGVKREYGVHYPMNKDEL